MTTQTTLKCLDCGNTENFYTIEHQRFTVEPTIYTNEEGDPTIDITDTNNFETTPITRGDARLVADVLEAKN